MIEIYVQKLYMRHSVFLNYCYIIYNHISLSAVLIDPAWDFELISNELKKNNLVLKAVLLTHAHIDHTNLANKIALNYHVPVYMSYEEIEYYHFKCQNLNAINSNNPLKIEDMTIMPILTPGHTKGSLCYLINNNLFTGDTIFYEGCGICYGPGASASDMYYSLKYIKHHINPMVRIYPGHSYGKEVGHFLKEILVNNIYFQIDNIEEFVLFRLRRSQKKWFDFK